MMRRTAGLSVASVIFSVVAAATIGNAYAGQTTRVSENAADVAANAPALFAALSGNGRYVVFQSSATNLVTGVSGTQVYRHDRATDEVVLVSVATTGAGGNAISRNPTITFDGDHVAFTSFASDLVPGGTSGRANVFRRDMRTGVTELVSANATGQEGDAGSALGDVAGAHQISDNGHYVVFASSATNLVPSGDGLQHIYRKDMSAGTAGPVVRVSLNDQQELGNRNSWTPSISRDGNVVAFRSESTNFSPLSTLGFSQVFVRDVAGGTTSLASVATSGLPQPLRHSTAPALSDDGRYVAFETDAVLHADDRDNGTFDVYLRHLAAPGSTFLASRSANTLFGPHAVQASVSGDGRWVAFAWLEDLPALGDAYRQYDVYLYDRTSEAITLVALNDDGVQADRASSFPSLSADGGLVLFGSTATNLVAAPSNGFSQLFVRDLAANQAPVLPALGHDVVLDEGVALSLTWSFSDDDASTSWHGTVDYGDGSGVQRLALNDNKTFSLAHSYAPGTYDLAVAVTDDAGATGTLVIHVVVNNVDPTVNLPSTLDLAFTRTLNASGSFTDPGSGSEETYAATVNWGDGTGTQTLALTGTSFALDHTYAAAGDYTVTVTVSDSNGGSTTATMAVHVGGYSYLWLDPVGTTFVVGRNLPVKFRVLGPDGSSVLDESVRVDVVDSSGSVVAGPYVFGDQPSRAVTWSSDSYHVHVDTRTLSPGMYWLRVRFSSSTLTGEFTLGTLGTAAVSSVWSSRLR